MTTPIHTSINQLPSNKLAVMQSYLLPYIGYFQLIKSVDKFVIFDDVNYIKRGWINTNNIYGPNGLQPFTVPLAAVSQNKLIKETLIHDNYEQWLPKFYKTLEHTYKKAPFYDQAIVLIRQIFDSCCPGDSIDMLCRFAFHDICKYLGIRTRIINSSSQYNNRELKGQERILDICRQEQATDYVNATGGKELYQADAFKKQSINLWFITMEPFEYKHFANSFKPFYSIIDLLMNCSADEAAQYIDKFKLVAGE